MFVAVRLAQDEKREGPLPLENVGMTGEEGSKPFELPQSLFGKARSPGGGDPGGGKS